MDSAPGLALFLVNVWNGPGPRPQDPEKDATLLQSPRLAEQYPPQIGLPPATAHPV